MYFALGNDGNLYVLENVQTLEAAEEEAVLTLPLGVSAVWLFDRTKAHAQAEVLISALTAESDMKISNLTLPVHTDLKNRIWFQIGDLYQLQVVKTSEGLVVDAYSAQHDGDSVASLQVLDSDVVYEE